ncbi:hypothetical protein ACVIRO_002356 [Rhizobium ruizarguesonis]
MTMRDVPGYPFFPCKICISEGYSGKNNDGCDHTALERARASGVNIHPGKTLKTSTDRTTGRLQ